MASIINIIVWLSFCKENHDREDYAECITVMFVVSLAGTPFSICYAIYAIVGRIFKT